MEKEIKEKKSNNKKIIIGIILLIVLVFGGLKVKHIITFNTVVSYYQDLCGDSFEVSGDVFKNELYIDDAIDYQGEYSGISAVTSGFSEWISLSESSSESIQRNIKLRYGIDVNVIENLNDTDGKNLIKIKNGTVIYDETNSSF